MGQGCEAARSCRCLRRAPTLGGGGEVIGRKQSRSVMALHRRMPKFQACALHPEFYPSSRLVLRRPWTHEGRTLPIPTVVLATVASDSPGTLKRHPSSLKQLFRGGGGALIQDDLLHHRLQNHLWPGEGANKQRRMTGL